MTGNAIWRKSSYSGGSGGDCVEVRDDTGRVLVRDTKDRTGPVLPFTPQAWRRFADRVKRRRRLARRPGIYGAPSRLEGARSAVLTKPTLLPWPKIGAGHRQYQWPTSGRYGQGNARRFRKGGPAAVVRAHGPRTSTAVTAPQVTSSIHDFAGFLGSV